MLFTSQGRSTLGKTVPSILCAALSLWFRWYPRPQAQFFLIQTSHLVNNIYIFYFSKKVEEKFNSLTVVSISYDLKLVSLKIFLILRLFMVWFWTFLLVLRIWFLWFINYLAYNLSETVSDKQISHCTETINVRHRLLVAKHLIALLKCSQGCFCNYLSFRKYVQYSHVHQ